MSEHAVLDGLLCFAFLLAPRMTNRFFFERDTRYAFAHGIALTVVVVSAALRFGPGAAVWPVFCLYGFLVHLLRVGRGALTIAGAASCVPFAFSVISAVWFVAGMNDLRLLGYDRAWSFYAALHGSVFGWLFVGCIAHLARRPQGRRLYALGCIAAFVLFLMVAFGIDGAPFLKRGRRRWVSPSSCLR
jgi:hypothetical protein